MRIIIEAPATISARGATLEILAQIFEANGVTAEWIGPDGGPLELTATWERAYCCVELSELGDDEEDDWRYLTFSAADPVRATADPKAIGRFVRRVNRRLKLVRASFNGEEVVFDYTAILTGGELPSRWVVGCLALLDNVIRHARETCDREKVLE